MEGEARTEAKPFVVDASSKPSEIGTMYIQDVEAGLSALSPEKANSLFGPEDVQKALEQVQEGIRRSREFNDWATKNALLIGGVANEVVMRLPARPTLSIVVLARCLSWLPKGARRDITAMAADQDAEIRQLRLEGKHWTARLGIVVTWIRALRLALAFGVDALVRMVVGAFKS